MRTALLLILLSQSMGLAHSAQIPGIPAALPPGVDRTFEILFGNDAFGGADTDDDFRTQQFGVTAELYDRWTVTAEQSLLTLDEPPPGKNRERIDQLSLTVGYEFMRIERSRSRHWLGGGAGVRLNGQYAGSRVQNGYHQLFSIGIKDMPYAATDRTDLTGWLRYNGSGDLGQPFALPYLGDGWQLGYWARGTALLTTDSQTDANLGLLATASRRWFQIWLGVQDDVRNGYNRDDVSAAVARYEEGLGVVFGMRFGPLLIETERQFNGDGATGRFSLISTGESLRSWGDNLARFSVQTGLTIPDVYLNLQGRWHKRGLFPASADLQQALVLGVLYGTPQYGDDVERFVETTQISAGMEWEQSPFSRADYASWYASLGLGWRSERLVGEGDALGGAKSSRADRAGLAGGIGLRFSTTAMRDSIALLLQIGLIGWLPSSAAVVDLAGQKETLQQAELNLSSGVFVRF
ncbi:MAG: hypothetical protein P8Y61_12690 [Gammaproteobacteria bacterium]